MIKIGKVTLKYTNRTKKEKILSFIDEYKKVVSAFVDYFWFKEKIPVFITTEMQKELNLNTWLSSRAVRCAGKQASGIVRGTRKKLEQLKWRVEQLEIEGKEKDAKKLKKILDQKNVSKPIIDKVNPVLDSRFININFNDNTSFDGWVTLASFGAREKIQVPIKKHRHINRLMKIGILKTSVSISSNNIVFFVEIEKEEPREEGTTIGIDIGIKNLLSCSNGFQSKEDVHGHDLDTILKQLLVKKKGSNGFKRKQEHRKNYINSIINKLNLDGVKTLRLENIKHLRFGKNTSKYLKGFTYTEIFGKLESYCDQLGVLIEKVSPTYTSQRCSVCGWTRKSNRNGKLFRCGKCGFEHDSDLNASINISLNLLPIGKQERLERNNLKGFYWPLVVS